MQTSETITKVFELPKLNYSYKSLEPYIDSETMSIHHQKHHAGYINNLNKAISEANIEDQSLENLLQNISKYPKAIRNNAGGHYNHSLFWNLVGSNCGGDLTKELLSAIDNSFDNLENFKQKFEKEAMSVFGSGWAWVVVGFNNEIKIGSTSNQDNPLMNDVPFNGMPILALDVWEHAYYLKYKNNRAEYVKNFWSIINWDTVDELYTKAINKIYM